MEMIRRCIICMLYVFVNAEAVTNAGQRRSAGAVRTNSSTCSRRESLTPCLISFNSALKFLTGLLRFHSPNCLTICLTQCAAMISLPSFQARPYDVPLFAWTDITEPRRSRHSSHPSCIATSATFRQPTPAHCASLSTQHVRPSPGFSGRWSDGLWNSLLDVDSFKQFLKQSCSDLLVRLAH